MAQRSTAHLNAAVYMPNFGCTTAAVTNHCIKMTILASFSDLDPLLQILEALSVLAMIAILVCKGSRALKRRNRDKIWQAF